MGQRGGGHVQRLKRGVDAGRDDAADIGAVAVHHIEGRGGPEIHKDQVAAMPVKARDSVDQAVGADRRPLIDTGRDRQRAVGLAHHQRAAVEIAVAEDAQVEDHARHGR